MITTLSKCPMFTYFTEQSTIILWLGMPLKKPIELTVIP